METKVSLKNIYLLMVITIGLVGLGLGSTFAMFTANAQIENPVSFVSTLSSTDKVVETADILVPVNEEKMVDIVVKNISTRNMQYAAWYKSSSASIEVAAASNNNSFGTTGILPSETSFILSITVRNNSSSAVYVTLGVSSDDSSAVFIPEGSVQVPLTNLTPLINKKANDYLKELYTDKKDASLISDKEENIRYYGDDKKVNNYLYFNCDNYAKQDNETCELWRIIGVISDKVKIIRNDSIGKASNIENWPESDLMKLLNPGYDNNLYWNREKGTCSINTTCDYSNSGLKDNKTKALISETSWATNKINSALSNEEIYNIEQNSENIWKGKIGLVALSDIKYASNSSAIDNWINKNDFEDVLTLNSNDTGSFDIKPTLYLNSNVYLLKGEGTLLNPYQIR